MSDCLHSWPRSPHKHPLRRYFALAPISARLEGVKSAKPEAGGVLFIYIYFSFHGKNEKTGGVKTKDNWGEKKIKGEPASITQRPVVTVFKLAALSI